MMFNDLPTTLLADLDDIAQAEGRSADEVLRDMISQYRQNAATPPVSPFFHICDTAVSAIIVANRAGEITYVNDSFIQFMNVDAYCTIETFWQIYTPSSLQKIQQEIYPFILTGQVWAGELEIIRADGVPRIVKQRMGALLDTQGQVMHCFVVFVDVTDQVQLQEKLQYQADLLQEVSDSIISVNRAGHITTWNRGAEMLYGYTEQEALGQFIHEVTYTQSPYNRTEFFRQRIQQDRTWEGELLQRHRDGRPLHVYVKASALYDISGEYVGMVGVGRDITARRQIDRLLRVQEEKTRLLMDATTVGLFIYQDSRIRYANKAALSILGYAYDELFQVPLEQLVQRSWRKLLALSKKITREDGSTLRQFEFQIMNREGEATWVHLDISLFEYQGKAAIWGTIIDITQRKKAEQQGLELAALQERQRLARDLHDSVSQSIFSAQTIAGMLLRLWEQNPQKVRQGLQELQDLTRHVQLEMRALLLELRPSALEEADLIDLLTQLKDGFQARTNIPVVLLEEGAPNLPDDVQVVIYRIIQEALNNITKHAKASTQVYIMVCAGAGGIQVSIQDNGRGFRLNQVSKNRMGIRIMRERAEAVNGRLAIYTAPGQGTHIHFEWKNVKRNA